MALLSFEVHNCTCSLRYPLYRPYHLSPYGNHLTDHLSFQVLVVAFTSMLWFLLKDGFVDVRDSNFESWTFGMLWDSAASFPWIPALYTGVFSTGLCMWAEVSLLLRAFQ